eukprot:gene3613-15048_t
MLADSYAPLFGKKGVDDGVKNWDLPRRASPTPLGAGCGGRDANAGELAPPSAFPTSFVPALKDPKYRRRRVAARPPLPAPSRPFRGAIAAGRDATCRPRRLAWFPGWGASYALSVFRVFPAARFGMRR